ncbi:hypothetical protein BaRGS_00032291 [Batillaria attramentaria]|uniref:Secreted protein n=1 Tax=Batillaria attramentaria TaxID=370345 RepID=A0ABD0JNT0_9CAEN
MRFPVPRISQQFLHASFSFCFGGPCSARVSKFVFTSKRRINHAERHYSTHHTVSRVFGHAFRCVRSARTCLTRVRTGALLSC